MVDGLALGALPQAATALRKSHALLVRFAGDLNIFKEVGQLFEQERLRTINQRAVRSGMEIYQNHVGSGDCALGGRMHDVQNVFRTRGA